MYLFFDTETTGLPKRWKAPLSDLDNWPRLVQLAWILYDHSGNEVERSNHIIRPEGFIIPKDVEKIHGISTERAYWEGVPLRKALEKFSTALTESKQVIAHNISFDEKILGAEFLREEMKHTLFDKPRICTKEISTEFCRLPSKKGYKWPTLSELHTILFEEDFKNAHNALNDVEACARCFFELKKRNVLDNL
ncbi:MAG: 3'-5' exonuclease [Nanoarchaeota archaeon]|nr:3'-5' exonuclease [Nanoarchaeota archaeon]MBU1644504.1 3'-5' exonuclease [Nanoarchaeota archaeon]MBU1976508.1 3'-5' exonuclease [Nanoarchaeota archaeon]